VLEALLNLELVQEAVAVLVELVKGDLEPSDKPNPVVIEDRQEVIKFIQVDILVHVIVPQHVDFVEDLSPVQGVADTVPLQVAIVHLQEQGAVNFALAELGPVVLEPKIVEPP